MAELVAALLVGHGSAYLTPRLQFKSSKSTTDEAHSDSDRKMLLFGAEYQASSDPLRQKLGDQVIEGVAQMPNLSPDNAALVQSLDPAALREVRSEARSVQAANPDTSVRFEIDDSQDELDG